MKKKGLALVLCALLLVFAGCASKMNAAPQEAPAMAPAPAEPMTSYADESGWGRDTVAEAEMDYLQAEDAGNVTPDPLIPTGQKIIKNANISLETREFMRHVQHIQERAQQMGGYVSSSHISGKEPESYYDSGRYATVTVRIPAEKLDTFLEDTRGLATVTSESVTAEDITAHYRDTESRLEVYTTQRERVMELLKKAETMEDIITLESELSRLTYEIENLTGSLRRWDDLVSYSTVHVDIREIPETTPVSGKDSFGTRVGEGFRSTMNGMAVFFENFAVFLISTLPVLVLLGIIAVVVLLIVRRSMKKQSARRAEQGGYLPPVSGYGAPTETQKKSGKKKQKEAPVEEESKE